jgi:hypothetical protein
MSEKRSLSWCKCEKLSKNIVHPSECGHWNSSAGQKCFALLNHCLYHDDFRSYFNLISILKESEIPQTFLCVWICVRAFLFLSSIWQIFTIKFRPYNAVTKFALLVKKREKFIKCKLCMAFSTDCWKEEDLYSVYIKAVMI